MNTPSELFDFYEAYLGIYEAADKTKPRPTVLRREDKESGFRKEYVEYVLDYLIDEGFTDSYESALVILETMSDQWFEDINEKFNPEDYKEYHQKDHRDDRLDDNDEDQWDREYKEYQRERAQKDRQRDVGRRKRAIAATIKERQRRARR